MLERGAHVDPRDFTENEADQLSNLYADGALTLSKDFRFQVAQGMCVGGSTVVNNAVCLDLPEPVLDRWIDPGQFDAGLDRQRLDRGVPRMCATSWRSSPLGPRARSTRERSSLVGAVCEARRVAVHARRGQHRRTASAPATATSAARTASKLSALDWTLPKAQRDCSGDAVRILPDCRVEKVLMRGAHARGRAAPSSADGRRLTVRANTVVLSAGALASSVILQRSGLGEGRAGRELAFNMASPVTFDFEEELHSERGLQITHYMKPADDEPRGARRSRPGSTRSSRSRCSCPAGSRSTGTTCAATST